MGVNVGDAANLSYVGVTVIPRVSKARYFFCQFLGASPERRRHVSVKPREFIAKKASLIVFEGLSSTHQRVS